MPEIRKHPLIGITTYGRDRSGNFYLPSEYVDAVRKASGVPLLLTPGESNIEEILQFVDGVMFSGGGDLDPALYGGAAHSTISRVDPERDAFEIALAKEVLARNRPVLGICRGSQILNVATGGDLVAHVPEEFGDEIQHATMKGETTEHVVKIEPESRLAEMLENTELLVKSKHHQANRSIPAAWQVAARAPDGVIEAVEHESHPWLFAVLWHPEMSLDDPNQQRIFEAFVAAATVK